MKKILLYGLLILLSYGCSKDDTYNESLPPELNFSGNIISCGDFFVSQALTSENTNIWVKINGTGRIPLRLDSEFQTFSIPNDELTASISLYDSTAGTLFCNDIIEEEQPSLISNWDAISGNIQLKVTNIEETEFETYYDISILIENMVFKNNDNNEKRTIEKLVIEETHVGWLPG